MNILRIIPTMNPSSGGPCQGIRNIIPELEKRGVHNEVVCLDDPSEDFLLKDNFSIIALGAAKGPWAYNSKLVPWLVDNLGRFDVVIIHALWLYHGYAFKKALRLYKKSAASSGKELKLPKFFVMPHGMLDPYFQQASERKLKALRNQVYWKLIESRLVNSADGLLFTCEAELLLAREPFRPYRPRREINIGYGIKSPPPFDDLMTRAFLEKCPQVKDQPYILFLSRIHQKKGTEHLIKAYAKLLDAIPGHKDLTTVKASFPKLVIAGPGLETPFGQKMQLLVSASESLQKMVFFPGMLTGNAKWGAFYGSEALILPSHQENFGIAVAESLACGKPVLISNKVNIWKEISAVNAGIIHDDTPVGTINLLKEFLALTDEEKDKMGRQARIAYEKYFDVSVLAQHFIDAI